MAVARIRARQKRGTLTGSWVANCRETGFRIADRRVSLPVQSAHCLKELYWQQFAAGG
jgi:hypothetical protein